MEFKKKRPRQAPKGGLDMINKIGQKLGCYEVIGLTNSPKYTYDCVWLCKCLLCGREDTLKDIYLQHRKYKKHINGCRFCSPAWDKDIQKSRRVNPERTNLPVGKNYIYIIEAEKVSCIKVGRTTNLDLRMLQLQSSCPIRLKFLYVFLGTDSDEKSLHKDLKSFRTYGEWFTLCKESLEIIVNYVNNNKILYQHSID